MADKRHSWNNKILDYEIETMIKRIQTVIILTWNNKILDYEIETQPVAISSKWRYPHSVLETIRFSITRLKLYMQRTPFSIFQLETIRFSITRLKRIMHPVDR